MHVYSLTLTPLSLKTSFLLLETRLFVRYQLKFYGCNMNLYQLKDSNNQANRLQDQFPVVGDPSTKS